MAVFKCKMCGAALEIGEEQSVACCTYCGTKQTLPRLTNERRAQLYDRANHFRRNNEFDKATVIYEEILNEEPADAEAYWSLVLCRYGVEYIVDPASGARVPTVTRAQYTSIFDDDNYRCALRYADVSRRDVYEREAAAINEIQKGILAISQKESPFDVFICYKESDESGNRTRDSVLATELYYQLTQEGFKVFFARITLEDKLGSAYEPYIFAALNSAKVMVVLGTKKEHFDAVWVKNEWSRYLALVKQSGGKKTLIPAYRDMDPYDLPKEFSHLQAQDMSKLGFMQDLIRGIKKIIVPAAPEVNEPPRTEVSSDALLKRARLALEDGEWVHADDFCEQVLNHDPENALAYLMKAQSDLHCRREEDLPNCGSSLEDNGNFRKAVRLADQTLRMRLIGYAQKTSNAKAQQAYTPPRQTYTPPRQVYIPPEMPIKRRNIFLCLLLTVLTCGIYMIVWFCKINKELKIASGDPSGASGGAALFFGLITCGLYLLYWYGKAGSKVNKIRGAGSGHVPLYLILALLGLGWLDLCLIQSKLNKVVTV